MNLRDLIGVLGHELRTPLAAILGYQELLADGLYGELNDRQREPVNRIQQSAQQLIHLLDGLQELADAGACEADEIVPGNTRQISQMLVTRLGPFAASRNVKLTATSLKMPCSRPSDCPVSCAQPSSRSLQPSKRHTGPR